MNKKPFTLILVMILIASTLGITSTVFALRDDARPALQSTLPQIAFLGEGPQTFTVEPPLKFLIKTYQNGQFLFVTRDGPTYEAKNDERVWTTNFVPAESIRLFDEERSYGNVAAGCVVHYVQIEDNVDNRRNTFYINGKSLQVVEQGMVTYGSFTVPEAGELTFFAEDSIGMVTELCQTVQTVVPSETPQVTVTGEPSVTATVGVSTPTQTATVQPPTVTVTATATSELIILPSVTPTVTSTATATTPANTPSVTPTTTATVPGLILTVTATHTAPAASPTATNTIPAPSPTVTNTAPAILITATPLATPAAIPVTGGGPGPEVILFISAAILGLFGLLAAGWWFLMRAFSRGR